MSRVLGNGKPVAKMLTAVEMDSSEGSIFFVQLIRLFALPRKTVKVRLFVVEWRRVSHN